MKQLVEYMKESLATNSPFALNEDRDQTIRLNDFEASWKVKDPENRKGIFVIEVPEDYTDDDINQYISDLLLESMPSDDDLAKEYFGANADNIIDARFEFEKKEARSYNDRGEYVLLINCPLCKTQLTASI